MENTSFFIEKEEVINIIRNISSSSQEDSNSSILDWKHSYESKFDWLNMTLSRYQEQPLLLNPHLPDLASPMTDRMKEILFIPQFNDPDSIDNFNQSHQFEQLNAICKVFQLLCRVRGYKHVMKQLPHDVDTLEPCFNFLQQQSWFTYTNWETKYTFLLWLRMLCLIPFDICSIDSTIHVSTSLAQIAAASGSHITSLVANASSSKLVSNIVLYTRSCLADTGPTRDAAALCLSTLLTRPDMEAGVLNHFNETCIEIFKTWINRGTTAASELSQKSFEMIGMLQCSCQVFKSGHRDKILSYASELLDIVLQLSKQSNQILVRKLVTKLIQRIGMTFLPPRIAAWRYQRGQRSLVTNLSASKADAMTIDSIDNTNKAEDNEAEDEEEVDVPEDMDGIFEYLLSALGDKDTIVRWSAAKGIGRLTCRLPMQLADDLIAALLQSFSQSNTITEESDSLWHGGCLALAELARRGALLPSRLDETVPIIIQAIKYDVVRGYHSVGAHVRDAACYVCWAFARAYSPQVLRKYMIIDEHDLSGSLAGAMLTTSLFDREVNCRRAASAAYQENVGRQGNQNFVNGLEIISIADYFSLGNRKSAYTSIAVAIARLSKENYMIIWQHLVQEKLHHWDIDIRNLAAISLGALVMLLKEEVALLSSSCREMILSDYHNVFITNSLHPSNASLRHGSILAVAEILLSLFKINSTPSSDIIDRITSIVPELSRLRLYRGKGSEYLRVASCNLMMNIAICNLPIASKKLYVLLENINENLKQPHESIQLAAQKALRQYLFSYFYSLSQSKNSKIESLTVNKYLDNLLKEENVAITRGYCLAIGCLPWSLIHDRIGNILYTLSCMCQVTKKIGGEPDPETRKNALLAITELTERSMHIMPHHVVFPDNDDKHVHVVSYVWNVLMTGCQDYSSDKRGDTGSWSRIVSLQGLERLIFAYRRMMLHHHQQHDHVMKHGCLVDTCYGVGVVANMISNDEDLIWVDYPNPSFGSYILEPHEKVFLSPSKAHLLSSSCDDVHLLSSVSSSMMMISRGCEEELVSLCLRQLAERLDAVRVVAGGILERLMTSSLIPSYLLPGRELMIWYLKSSSTSSIVKKSNNDDDNVDVGDVKDDDDASSSSSLFPWNKSYHVFAFLKHVLIMLPSSYMSSILSGLIMSIGGLSETIAKESFQVIIDYHHRHTSSSSSSSMPSSSSSVSSSVSSPSSMHHRIFYQMMVDIIISSYLNPKKSTRAQGPVLKCIELCFRHNLLQPSILSYDYHTCLIIMHHIMPSIFISSDIAKLRVMIDIVVHMLVSHGILRVTALAVLLHLLAHRFPKIRTYVAEALYLALISDPDPVGAVTNSHIYKRWHDDHVMDQIQVLADDASLSYDHDLKHRHDLCLSSSYASSTAAFDEGLDLLTSSSWSDMNDEILHHRERLCQLFDVDLSIIAAASASSSASMKKKNDDVAIDELESYSSLVREAGY